MQYCRFGYGSHFADLIIQENTSNHIIIRLLREFARLQQSKSKAESAVHDPITEFSQLSLFHFQVKTKLLTCDIGNYNFIRCLKMQSHREGREGFDGAALRSTPEPPAGTHSPAACLIECATRCDELRDSGLVFLFPQTSLFLLFQSTVLSVYIQKVLFRYTSRRLK